MDASNESIISTTPVTVSHRRRAIACALVAAAFAGAALLPAPRTAAAAGPIRPAEHRGHHAQDADDLVWGPAPDVFPPGAEMAVLAGDPSVAGQVFTVRLRFPDGYVVPPHWHPTDEFVTVMSGTFLVGLGDAVDRSALLPPLHRGGFVTAPAYAHHFAIAKGRTVVQVHAVGPFQLTYVDRGDDPRPPR